jgi:hypothetical protein
MQTGRPVGVMLERMAGLGQAAVMAYQVEVPPAYSGEVINSAARVTYAGSSGITVTFNLTASNIVNSKIQVGDQVQFNNQGPLYLVASVNPLRVQLDIRDRKTWPWPSTGSSPPVPFKFFRQPIRSPVAPLELPSAVAIDLQSSGTDVYPYLFTPIPADASSTAPTQIAFMFSPSGALDRVYFRSPYTGNDTFRMIREPVYLLVGRRDRIQVAQDVTTATLEDQYPNWFDASSIWLTVSPLTGIVAAKENFMITNMLQQGYGVRTRGLPVVRTVARQAQTMGGR